ncbi:MAG: FHA domain-containing protein [Kiritimatiellae bacterium]|nr:FHA domain-containing protein [Kiritimatiellia bacterium]
MVTLNVIQGPEQGKLIPVPAEGIRIGRSSKNDAALTDPLLSRYHCRVFCKPDGRLCVADLGSANQTIVNGNAVDETTLKKGDIIVIGDTHMRVETTAATSDAGAIVDLGLQSQSQETGSTNRSQRLRWLCAAAAAMILLALLIWVPKLGTPPEEQTHEQERASATPDAVHINYEKIQATPDNIFRYHFILDGNLLQIAIDDIANNRHVRKETDIADELLQNLVRTIRNSGFFALKEAYKGVQPDTLDRWDLSVTIGHKTHRVQVENRVEPEEVINVRQSLEAFGKNELGLWAIQFSAERLIEMSEEAYALGKKLRSEREVDFGNLAKAIKSFREAEWYLETVEEKPDYHLELRSLIGECEQLLDVRYNDQNFLAERAIRLRDWGQAARELRIVCEIIPDRADTRHQEARKKLLDVEARLASQQ